jgi:hypothetical protein
VSSAFCFLGPNLSSLWAGFGKRFRQRSRVNACTMPEGALTYVMLALVTRLAQADCVPIIRLLSHARA